MTAPFTAWFDRRPDTIAGYFTIQDLSGKPVFKRLSARSGQMAHVGSNWTRGKSPIPLSSAIDNNTQVMRELRSDIGKQS